MKKLLIATALMAVTGSAASAQPAASKVSITRLDCGTVAANNLNLFSDTDAYVGKSKRLVVGCYLIRHADKVMLWDAGLPAAIKGKPIDPKLPMDATVTRTIPEQLAALGIKPEQVTIVGISHYHFDHTGQAASFPGATLLIGANDWAAVSAKPPAPGINAAPLQPWIGGGAKVDPVTGDRDVFGDGSVRMIDMPGHTPGHHSLLVRLKGRSVLLTGDVAHFTENYAADGVPSFNTNRADTLASLDRFKKMAANLNATVIIQHEPADVAKLPAFPAAAE
ncbi:MAG: beta-lactamase domain protein [Sphingomonas bacterium]|uniref:N-acyl homoserine lactonase family protein n=1 Tax=Sphingomonas bacterium TaxID=1895847 RepID=UPI00262ACD91|nr:N-acyl homoserine lactonase family protein [Sphingomonas bacterium]MDB5696336.1 beta-lactamase domain protein [Sphingomonas bacterium]